MQNSGLQVPDLRRCVREAGFCISLSITERIETFHSPSPEQGHTYRMYRMPKAEPHRIEVPTERRDAIEACL